MSLFSNVSVEKKCKVAVCIPARDQMHTATSFHLYNLGVYLTKHGIENNLFISSGTLIVNQRQVLVKEAQLWGATHVLFVDSDMEFDPLHVQSLINKDLDIVAAAYSKRVEPLHSTAWLDSSDWTSTIDPFNYPDTTEIIEAQAVGMGLCLIKIEVFDKIEQPWFRLGWRQEQYIGEDIEFCKLAIDAGYKVYVDLIISREIGHLGTKSFKFHPVV
jgi:hypothetical protein